MANLKLPRRRFMHLALGAAALPVSRTARAQAYPTRPVRIIVGFAAGGPADIFARLLAQWLSDRLGQQFLIEHRPGAGSNIGTEAVVRALLTDTRYFLPRQQIPSTRRSTTGSTSISSGMSRRLLALSDCQMSWCYIPPFQPGQYRNSLPMPKLTQANSTLQRRQGHQFISPVSCSR